MYRTLSPLLTCMIILLIVPTATKAQLFKRDKKVTEISTILLGQEELETYLGVRYAGNVQLFNFDTPPYEYNNQDFSSFSTDIRITYGPFYEPIINFGFDLSSHVILNQDSVLNDTHLGPRVRWSPFYFSDDGLDIIFEHSVHHAVTRAYKNLSRWRFTNSVIISKLFEPSKGDADFILQAKAGISVMPANNKNLEQKLNPTFRTPYTLLLGVYPNSDWLIFLSGEYQAEYGPVPSTGETSYFLRRTAIYANGGIQYKAGKNLWLNASLHYLVSKERVDAGSELTVGLRSFF